MENQEIWGHLGYAIDMTKMSHLVWKEISSNVYENKKSEIFVGKTIFGIRCSWQGEDVTEQGGELKGEGR